MEEKRERKLKGKALKKGLEIAKPWGCGYCPPHGPGLNAYQSATPGVDGVCPKPCGHDNYGDCYFDDHSMKWCTDNNC